MGFDSSALDHALEALTDARGSSKAQDPERYRASAPCPCSSMAEHLFRKQQMTDRYRTGAPC